MSTVPPSTSVIFLPIFMFESEIIFVPFLRGHRWLSERYSADSFPDTFQQLALVKLDLVLTHAHCKAAGHLFLACKRRECDYRELAEARIGSNAFR